jgi:hypothetical protein
MQAIQYLDHSSFERELLTRNLGRLLELPLGNSQNGTV